jgi:hypothetical protein
LAALRPSLPLALSYFARGLALDPPIGRYDQDSAPLTKNMDTVHLAATASLDPLAVVQGDLSAVFQALSPHLRTEFEPLFDDVPLCHSNTEEYDENGARLSAISFEESVLPDFEDSQMYSTKAIAVTEAAKMLSMLATTALTGEELVMTAPTSEELMMMAPTSAELMMTAPTSAELLMTAPTSEELVMMAPTSAELVMTAPTSEELMVTTPTSAELVMTAPTSEELMMMAPTSEELMMMAPTSEELVMKAPTSEELVMTAPTSEELVTTAPTCEEMVATASTSAELVTTAPTCEEMLTTALSGEEQVTAIEEETPRKDSTVENETKLDAKAVHSDMVYPNAIDSRSPNHKIDRNAAISLSHGVDDTSLSVSTALIYDVDQMGRDMTPLDIQATGMIVLIESRQGDDGERVRRLVRRSSRNHARISQTNLPAACERNQTGRERVVNGLRVGVGMSQLKQEKSSPKGVIAKDRTRKIKEVRQRVALPSEFISTMNAWAAANTFYPFMSDVEKSEISISMGVTFNQVCCMDIIK